MSKIEEHFILPGEIEGEDCEVHEVYHREVEHRLSFVTSGWIKPTLRATVQKAMQIDPLVTRIRIMTSDAFDLAPLYIFELVDGVWRARSLVPLQTR